MKKMKSSLKAILISVVSFVCVASAVLGCVFGIKDYKSKNSEIVRTVPASNASYINDGRHTYNGLEMDANGVVVGLGSYDLSEAGGHLLIPNGVSGIDASAFSGITAIKSVTIPLTISAIGEGAFAGCSKLLEVNFVSSYFRYSKKIDNRRVIDVNYSLESGESDCLESIGNGAFSGCKKLKSIEIPYTVTTIGDEAFAGCEALSKVTFNHVEPVLGYIGTSAFIGCSALKIVAIPESVTTADDAFVGCDNITVCSYGLGFLGSNIDSNGDLKSDAVYCDYIDGSSHYTGDDQLDEPGEWYFNTHNEPAIKGKQYKIYIDGRFAETFENGNSNLDITRNINFTHVSLIDQYGRVCNILSGLNEDLYLTTSKFDINEFDTNERDFQFEVDPDSPNGELILTELNFGRCGSPTLTIPAGISVIGNRGIEAEYSPYSELILPHTLKAMVAEAISQHYNSYNFGKITFKNFEDGNGNVICYNQLQYIGEAALSVSYEGDICDDGVLEFPANLKYTEHILFNKGQTTTVLPKFIFGRSCLNLSDYSIYSSDLAGYDFAVSGNPYFDSRFNCNSIVETSTNTMIVASKNSSVPESIEIIGRSCFSYIDIETVSLPTTLTKISSEAFYNCGKLASITLNNGLKTIGSSAFFSCDSLENINIPASVTSIIDNPFRDCDKLKYVSVDSKNTLYTSQDASGQECNAIIKKSSNELIVGSGTTIIPNTVTTIGDQAFYGNNQLVSINIPSSVTTIGVQAFYECSFLKYVTFENGLQTISETAFAHCENLNNITLPSSLKTISISAFLKCSKLSDISIENTSLTEIGTSAFGHCSSLKSITFPSSLQTISNNAFDSCGLTSVNIPANVSTVGTNPFRLCKELRTLTVDSNNSKYTSFGVNALFETSTKKLITGTISNAAYKDAFNSFLKLPSVIGDSAFWGMDGLIYTLKIPSNITAIENNAFYSCSKLPAVDFSSVSSGFTIGRSAFTNCYNLIDFVIPTNVTSIGYDAFYVSSYLSPRLKNIYSAYSSRPSGYDSSFAGSNVNVYYYKTTQPTTSGLYWRYVGGYPQAWNGPNTITYNTNGGYKDSSLTYPTTYVSGTAITIPEPKHTSGYSFGGWIDQNLVIRNKISTGTSGQLQLTAQWGSAGLNLATISGNENGAKICNGLGTYTGTSLKIPEGVTQIKASAFKSKTTFTLITLPNT